MLILCVFRASFQQAAVVTDLGCEMSMQVAVGTHGFSHCFSAPQPPCSWSRSIFLHCPRSTLLSVPILGSSGRPDPMSKYSFINLRTNCHTQSGLGHCHGDPQSQDPGRILVLHILHGISGPGLRGTSCPLHPSPESSRTHPQSSHCHGCVTCPSTAQHRDTHRAVWVGSETRASSAPASFTSSPGEIRNPALPTEQPAGHRPLVAGHIWPVGW